MLCPLVYQFFLVETRTEELECSTAPHFLAGSMLRTYQMVSRFRRNLQRSQLTESVEFLVGGGERVVFVQRADFSGALISRGHRTHLPLLGGAAGRLLLLLCQLPVVVRRRDVKAPHTHMGRL